MKQEFHLYNIPNSWKHDYTILHRTKEKRKQQPRNTVVELAPHHTIPNFSITPKTTPPTSTLHTWWLAQSGGPCRPDALPSLAVPALPTAPLCSSPSLCARPATNLAARHIPASRSRSSCSPVQYLFWTLTKTFHLLDIYISLSIFWETSVLLIK